MSKSIIQCLLAITMLGGCTSVALRDSAVSAASSVTDLQYQLVLGNLAMFRNDRASLPWHLKITDGYVQVLDTVGPSFGLKWPGIERTATINVSRNWAAQWNVVPVTDVDELKRLRDIYVDAADPPTFEASFDEGDHPPADVPYGSYRGRFVWPKPGHLQDLTDLTLHVLRKSAVKPEERSRGQQGAPLLIR